MKPVYLVSVTISSQAFFVITNIFRDQMDRYGEIYTTYKMILDAIRKVPTATVLLNGDSPLFYKPDIPNHVQYFGFDLEKGPAREAHYNTEGILCPDCQGILKYEHNTYANLGAYICESCGCKRPNLDYRLTELVELTNNRSRFVIDGQEYGIQIGWSLQYLQRPSCGCYRPFPWCKSTTHQAGI